MIKRGLVVCLIATAMLLPQTALAWNATGHEVVARIAWEKMEPQTRQRVIALMMKAPSDADLVSLLLEDARPLIFRQRDFFMIAATWPDIIRSDEFPDRKRKYSHSNWHYTNLFWKEQNGVPVDVPELQPEAVNIVERLNFLRNEIADGNVAASQRAIDIAWILHLVGDIHQPLHASARVTETEPTGDQGATLFLLTPNDTPPKESKKLHWYWDDILNKSFRRKLDETDVAFVNRIASTIMQRHAPATMTARLKKGEFGEWAKESLASAKASAYPPWLKRFRTPTERYRKQAYRVAEPAIALAGYRLAALLDSLFGQ